MNCKKCGSPLTGGEKVCKICGEVVESNNPSPNGGFLDGQNMVNTTPTFNPNRQSTGNNFLSGIELVNTPVSSNVQNSQVMNKQNDSSGPVQNETGVSVNIAEPTPVTIPNGNQAAPVNSNVQNSQVMNNQVQISPISETPAISTSNQNPQLVQAQPMSSGVVASSPVIEPVNTMQNSASIPQSQPVNSPQNATPVEQVQTIAPESVTLNPKEEKKKKPNKVVKFVFLIIEFTLIIFIGVYVGNIVYKNIGNSKTNVPKTTIPTTEPTTAPTTNPTEESTKPTEPTTSSTTTVPVSTETTTVKVTETAAKCSAIECIKLIKPENTVEEINNIIGLKGEVTDAKYNRYYWKITEDSGIEVAYYSGEKGNIFVKINNNSLVNESVSFAKFESDIKPRISTGITYKEIVDILGKIEGTLVEKSSYSTKYQWVNKNGEVLKVTINNQTEKCTFATVVKGD